MPIQVLIAAEDFDTSECADVEGFPEPSWYRVQVKPNAHKSTLMLDNWSTGVVAEAASVSPLVCVRFFCFFLGGGSCHLFWACFFVCCLPVFVLDLSWYLFAPFWYNSCGFTSRESRTGRRAFIFSAARCLELKIPRFGVTGLSGLTLLLVFGSSFSHL